ncbi:MAG: carbohydrate kinase family protein [Bifidobacteriaceae bacterium]|jgi:pseudouridine kinase|nr:carbohydrate kinase family protein [Bifidobacteriaceae bacterium]
MQYEVVVIGALNRDVGGKSDGQLIPMDSNIGKVSETLGGVGNNIAQNLANMGVSVKFIAPLGDDAFSQYALGRLESIGIGMSDALIAKNQGSATYLYVLDDTGEMQVAINDMGIVKLLTPEFLATKLDTIDQAKVIVIDANLTVETIKFIAENVTQPIFADPTSVEKAERMQPVLDKIHTLAPNRIEAQHLTEIETNDLVPIADKLLETGLKRAVITTGKDGCYIKTANEQVTSKPAGVVPVNVTGAGDALTAALVYAYLHDFPLQKTADFASRIGALATQSAKTISDEITPEVVKSVIEELE